ncbi:TraC family protein [Campylobacter sp. MIT 97-5078]|uniref:TraC family protein n=1 Tax=Campylobacter sp. MIT 97-5078 TaxID=1548153 RepID=UPI000B2E8CD4|nr:TraC family protein [Campylobacter sp. MIT 97-5078]
MSFMDFIASKMDKLKEPAKDLSSLPTQTYNALFERYKFSDFLPYMSFDENEGIYINNDNSYGCIFFASPRIRMGESTATAIEEMLSKLSDDTFLQFMLFGSKNIRNNVEYWKHEHLKRANFENNELLRKAVINMSEFYYSKTKEGVSRSMTAKIKNFILLISIKSDKKENIVQYKDTLKNILSANHFGGHLVKPQELKPILYEILNPNHDINGIIPPYDENCYINKQIIAPSTKIIIKDTHIEVDDKSYISLATQSLPKIAHISDFGEK